MHDAVSIYFLQKRKNFHPNLGNSIVIFDMFMYDKNYLRNIISTKYTKINLLNVKNLVTSNTETFIEYFLKREHILFESNNNVSLSLKISIYIHIHYLRN